MGVKILIMVTKGGQEKRGEEKEVGRAERWRKREGGVREGGVRKGGVREGGGDREKGGGGREGEEKLSERETCGGRCGSEGEDLTTCMYMTCTILLVGCAKKASDCLPGICSCYYGYRCVCSCHNALERPFPSSPPPFPLPPPLPLPFPPLLHT